MNLKTAIVSTAIVSAFFAASASGDVLAQWTFETNTPPDLSNSATSPLVQAEAGVFAGASSIGSGVHVSTGTDWTTPAGNGSTNSLSSNEWAVGDYYQFSTSTIGYQAITIAWDQTGSNTGPRDFQLSYSTDGTNFTNFGAGYQLINGGWSSGTPVLTTSFSQDLSSITALDNVATIWFRMSVTSTTNISGTAAVATAGTGRVDNIVINGTVVPAPGAMALLGLAGLIGARRRRS